MLEKKIKAFRLQMADRKTEGDVVGTCGINCLEANSRRCGTCGHILVFFFFRGLSGEQTKTIFEAAVDLDEMRCTCTNRDTGGAVTCSFFVFFVRSVLIQRHLACAWTAGNQSFLSTCPSGFFKDIVPEILGTDAHSWVQRKAGRTRAGA
jgi:hypothetical protein